MTPTLINRMFYIVTSIWIGVLIKRTDSTEFSLIYSICLIVLMIVLSGFLQACIFSEDKNRSIKLVLLFLFALLCVTGALVALELLFYNPDPFQNKMIFLLPILYFLWLATMKTIKYIFINDLTDGWSKK